MRLQNKKILVTGGSKGIGKGISKIFLQQGAELFICSRNIETLEDTISELSEYGNIDCIQANLTDLNDVENLIEKIRSKWNYLDVLVNNASILGLRVNIEQYPENVWNDVIDVNLNAQFYVTKKLIPLLKKETGSSSIINVSSSVGRTGRANWGAYSVSKSGLEALTTILSQELEIYNIRVNSVNPGGTRTDMRAEAYPEEDPFELPTPEDISPIFVYLASDESIQQTGNKYNARDWIK